MIVKFYEDFFLIKEEKEIKKFSKPLLIEYNKELMEKLHRSEIEFAVFIKTIPQAVFANYYQAKYLLVEKKIANKIQQIANEYLFDSKVLVKACFEWEIETYAQQGIDGIILRRKDAKL